MPAAKKHTCFGYDTAWIGYEGSDAAAPRHRSPEDWSGRTAEACADDELIGQHADENRTIIDKNKARFAFYRNLVLRQVYHYNGTTDTRWTATDLLSEIMATATSLVPCSGQRAVPQDSLSHWRGD